MILLALKNRSSDIRAILHSFDGHTEEDRAAWKVQDQLATLEQSLRRLHESLEQRKGLVTTPNLDDLELLEHSLAYTLQDIWAIMGRIPMNPTGSQYKTAWKEICRHCYTKEHGPLELQLETSCKFADEVIKQLLGAIVDTAAFAADRLYMISLRKSQLQNRRLITAAEAIDELTASHKPEVQKTLQDSRSRQRSPTEEQHAEKPPRQALGPRLTTSKSRSVAVPSTDKKRRFSSRSSGIAKGDLSEIGGFIGDSAYYSMLEAGLDLSTSTSAQPANLFAQQRQYLVDAFVRQLIRDVSARGSIDESFVVPEDRLFQVLTRFAELLNRLVRTKKERDATDYILLERHRIAERINSSHLSVSIPQDISHSYAREDGIKHSEAVYGQTTSDASHVLQSPEHTEVPLMYQEVRSFLYDSHAYQWVLDALEASMKMAERRGTFLEKIIRDIDTAMSDLTVPKSARTCTYETNINVDANIVQFLKEQNYGVPMEEAVGKVITITGSSTSAQALSCNDYIAQTWPKSGVETLQVLQNALSSSDLTYKGHHSSLTFLEVDLSHGGVVLRANGSQGVLTELCEQLCWLGAAFQILPVSGGLCCVKPEIIVRVPTKRIKSTDSIHVVQISLTYQHNLMSNRNHNPAVTCWHAMFGNGMIIEEFPIKPRMRDQEVLELSFELMTELAQVQFVTSYDATLVLKGNCTLLVPTSQDSGSITWHFLMDPNGKRISYNRARAHCGSLQNDQPIAISRLEDKETRHFVGWTSVVNRFAGTKDMNYADIGWAGSKKCSAGLAVEQKLTISLSKLIGFSGSVLRGSKDKPEHLKRSAYRVQVENARRIYVVLYDVAVQKAWLTDGASALLHLVRAQTVKEPYGGHGSLFNDPKFNDSTFNYPGAFGGPDAAAEALRDEANQRHIVLREFDSYVKDDITIEDPSIQSHSRQTTIPRSDRSEESHNTSTRDRTKASYKITSFKDLVSEAWSTLEQMYDRQLDISTTHTTKHLDNPFRTVLEGYEFMGIVSARPTLSRRVVKLSSNGDAWLPLISTVNAITLLGRNFGDIYKPAQLSNAQICQSWRALPRGHDFLAVPISVLKDIRRHSWEEGEIDPKSQEIVEGFTFSPCRHAFRVCSSGCHHDFNRVHCLQPTKGLLKSLGTIDAARGSMPINNPFAESDGAVIFGKSSSLNPGNIIENLPEPSVSSVDSFSDSGLGRSLSASTGDVEGHAESQAAAAETQDGDAVATQTLTVRAGR